MISGCLLLIAGVLLGEPLPGDGSISVARDLVRDHVACLRRQEAELEAKRQAVRDGTLLEMPELREGVKSRLALLAELVLDERDRELARKYLVPAFEAEERELTERAHASEGEGEGESEGDEPPPSAGSVVLRALADLESQRLSAAQDAVPREQTAGEPQAAHAPATARESGEPRRPAAPKAGAKSQPTSSPDLLRAADNLYKIGKFEQALALYEQVEGAPGGGAFVLYRRGECLLRLNRYDEGAQLLTRASRTDPDSVWAKQAGRSLQIANALRKLPDQAREGPSREGGK